MRILKLLGLVVAVILLVFAWDSTARLRGQTVARIDIARGHYRVLGYGLPSGGRHEYARLLKERYGIEYGQEALCIVSESSAKYYSSYNEVSMAAAKRKIGHDVFLETWEESERNWLRQIAAERGTSVPHELYSYRPDKKSNVERFSALTPGMSMDALVEKCGKPDQEIGSATYVFLYHMPDGSVISVDAPYLSRVDKVVCTDRRGSRSTLLGPN